MKRNCRGRVGNGEEKNRESVEIKMIGDRKRERESRERRKSRESREREIVLREKEFEKERKYRK